MAQARQAPGRSSVEYAVRLLTPHPVQQAFIECPAPRVVIRAGRRGGKTTGVSILAVKAFLDGKRVLYAVPTDEQVDAFWHHVKNALREPLDAGVLRKNETRHVIEVPGTRTRIRAKTAWDADTLRGDFADLLIMDEFQMMSEDAWNLVGAPMLADNNGRAVFIYTPPSIHSAARSKARDKMHAAKLFKRAQADETGRWATFHFSSRANPYISQTAIEELAHDMTAVAYRQEIEAEDIDEVPGALWSWRLLEETRVHRAPGLTRIVVAVDPPASAGGVAGIIAAGRGEDDHGYVLEDASISGTPAEWARQAVAVYGKWEANALVVETNQGGDMVKHTIHTVDPRVNVVEVRAAKGKVARAEPVAALYEAGNVHHVGAFPALEEEYVSYLPGDPSPNHLDAAVWAVTELMLKTPERTARVRSRPRA